MEFRIEKVYIVEEQRCNVLFNLEVVPFWIHFTSPRSGKKSSKEAYSTVTQFNYAKVRNLNVIIWNLELRAARIKTQVFYSEPLKCASAITKNYRQQFSYTVADSRKIFLCGKMQ